MDCKHCHKDIPDDAKYCHLCGREQNPKPKRHRRHRPQSQGSIVKLSGGNRANPYWARLPADYSSGAPVRESLGCYPTYAAAAEALTKAMYTPEQTEHKKKTITLQDIYDRFVCSHYFANLTKSSQGSHKTAWKYLYPCATVPVSEINKDTFQRPVDNMRESGLKRESMAKVRNLASLLCKEAMGLKMMSTNYGALVQLPRADSEPAKPFSSKEIMRIWAAAEGEGDRDAMTLLVLIYTGMRPGELLSVDIAEHLHIEGQYWYIRHGSKTDAGRNRIIPLPMILHDVINVLVDGRSTGPLIAAEQGGYWRLDNWRHRRFLPLTQRLSLKGAVPYSARHTYANLLKRRRIDPLVAKEVFGHADYATTVERYQSTTEEDIAQICAAIDDIERP